MTNKIGKKRKITFWTRLGFGMGGMLNSGALTFTHSYMVLFLSTECGLSAGEAALIRLVRHLSQRHSVPAYGLCGR